MMLLFSIVILYTVTWLDTLSYCELFKKCCFFRPSVVEGAHKFEKKKNTNDFSIKQDTTWGISSVKIWHYVLTLPITMLSISFSFILYNYFYYTVCSKFSWLVVNECVEWHWWNLFLQWLNATHVYAHMLICVCTVEGLHCFPLSAWLI